MLAHIVLNDGNVIPKKIDKPLSSIGGKMEFIKSLVAQGGVWDYEWINFYPYHTITKIEFREG